MGELGNLLCHLPRFTLLTPCARAHDAARPTGQKGGRKGGKLKESGGAARELVGRRGAASEGEVLRFVGEPPVFEHVLGAVVTSRRGLDAQVSEHRVGLPAAEELDGELVDVGAEEGGGATRSEAAGTDSVRVDARLSVELRCGVTQGDGDVLGSDASRLSDVVIDSADRRVIRSRVLTEVADKAEERLDRAQ